MPEIIVKLRKLHSGQQEILDNKKRFNVIKCGRRFGKTILTENLAIEPALQGKTVGYWTPTYKDVSKVWDSIKFMLGPIIAKKDEQLKKITLITGGQIDFWSLEDPNNGRGFNYHRAIVDECEKARHFKEAWERVIRPALADNQGDAFFLSTPQFGPTYFKTIFRNREKKGYEDWQSYNKSSYSNPYLLKSELDALKSQMDELTFKCEILAEDVDVVGKPFAYAFSEEKHVGVAEFNGDKEILLSFDFNVDPIVCVAAQQYDDRIEYIKDFKLENSNIHDLCDMVKAYFPFAVFLVTGDATGHNRSALTKGNINYYTVIKQKLNLVETQLKQPSVNPAVSDRRVLLNSILQNYTVIFDKDNCHDTINDMKYVEVDDNGDIKKDRSDDNKKADLLDAASYLLCTFMPNFIQFYHADSE